MNMSWRIITKVPYYCLHDIEQFSEQKGHLLIANQLDQGAEMRWPHEMTVAAVNRGEDVAEFLKYKE